MEFPRPDISDEQLTAKLKEFEERSDKLLSEINDLWQSYFVPYSQEIAFKNGSKYDAIKKDHDAIEELLDVLYKSFNDLLARMRSFKQVHFRNNRRNNRLNNYK